MVYHVLINADLETDEGRDAVLALGVPDLAYTDPPWSQGNLKWWRTHNGQPEHAVSFERFITNLAIVVCRANRDVFVETSVQGDSLGILCTVFEARGGKLLDLWRGLYGSPKRPFYLTRWGFAGHDTPWPGPDLSGMGGMILTRAAISAVARIGDIILDPCIGRGMTLRIGLELGCIVWGNDLNAKRLACCEEIHLDHTI